jgi:hypothetical protein
VHRQRLADDPLHGHARVERAERVLEDDLQVAAQAAHLRRRQRHHVGAVVDDLPGVGLDQAQDQPAGRRLAAARLADQAERLAAADGEVDAVDRAHHRARPAAEPQALAHREMLDQTGRLEQDRAHFAASRGAGSA